MDEKAPITDADRWQWIIERIGWVQMMQFEAFAIGISFTDYVDRKIRELRRQSS